MTKLWYGIMMANLIKRYNSKVNSSISFLVMSGAMQTRYDQFHSLVQFLLNNFGNVYSLELPGHGENNDFITDQSDYSLDNVLGTIYTSIDRSCPKDNLIIIAYSIASLMIIKLSKKLITRNKDLKMIFLGSALRIRDESFQLINSFFSKEFYKKLGWEPIMAKQHGETWAQTIKLIDSWMLPGSGITATESDISILLKKSKDITFIISENDQPFNPSDVLDVGEFIVHIIPGDHFSYFIKKRSWPKVKEIIINSLSEWNIMIGS